jgi:hypothetical protein
MKTLKTTFAALVLTLAFTACTENDFSKTEELNDLSQEQTDGFSDGNHEHNGSKD